MTDPFFTELNRALDRCGSRLRHEPEAMETTDEWDEQSRLEYEQYLDQQEER